jgi:hypothetical protein
MDEYAFNVLLAEGTDIFTAYAASVDDAPTPISGARGIGLLIGVALVLACTVFCGL